MTTLAGLPVELLLSISECLSLVDLICLSLCNHRLLEVIQRQIDRLSPLTQGDKPVLLTRLERDHPEYFACDICDLLHRYDGSESFGLSGLLHEQTSQILCARMDDLVTGGFKWFGPVYTLFTHPCKGYSQCYLSFLQIKLAMRRFRYGPTSGISTDSLSYTQVRQYPPQSVHPDTISLFSTEAQIYPEPLGFYVRMQDIVLVRKRDELLDFPKIWMSKSFKICVHCCLLEIITPLVESLHHGESSFANTCHKCNLSVQIEIVDFGSKTALIMTRWVNLGSGLTPNDPMWRNHVDFCIGPRPELDGDEHILMTRSPRLSFEDIAPQPLEDLRSRNLFYLKDQQYKIAMSFVAEVDLWHISYKEPSKGIIGSLWSLMGL